MGGVQERAEVRQRMQNEMEKIERLKFVSGMLDQILSEGDINMSLWKETECQALGSLNAGLGMQTCVR